MAAVTASASYVDAYDPTGRGAEVKDDFAPRNVYNPQASVKLLAVHAGAVWQRRGGTLSVASATLNGTERGHDGAWPSTPADHGPWEALGGSRDPMKPDLAEFYRRQLLDDCLPFWLEHGRDRECGGFQTCLNRDGSAYDLDKLCMWCHGRMIWTFSFLYNELEPNPEWLDMARAGVAFVQAHGFAPDRGMYYALTRDGRPLMPAQDIYVELFTASGFSEFARATADEALYERARTILFRVWDKLQAPGQAFQPFLAATRPVRVHGHSMITLNVIQELRRFRQDPAYDDMIDQCVRNMLDLHLRPDRHALLEVVTWDGEDIPGSMGRWINPGHMMEGGIFLIHEGRRRQGAHLVQAGVDLIDWGFERGWDPAFGGIFNDVDLEDLPVPTAQALLSETKLWWQHTEALYALLLAHAVTRDARFMDAYDKVHDYSCQHFADPEHGEWFGLLDRRGNRINDAKGSARKSPFHLARNCYYSYRLAQGTAP